LRESPDLAGSRLSLREEVWTSLADFHYQLGTYRINAAHSDMPFPSHH
jgi:hypothetical protein